jgi:hypothetical protein
MSDPVTYNFYLTTVPVLRNITISAINVLRTAKDEQSKSSLPADEQILDSTFGDILPFRVQPMLLAKFSVAALEFLKLPKAGVPALRADFKTLDEMIMEFFQGIKAVFDSIDEKGYNEAAEKSCDVSIGPGKPTLHMTGLFDYFHGFAIPNSYFHLNAINMMLGNAGFNLGQDVYLETFMSEQQQKDWAYSRG